MGTATDAFVTDFTKDKTLHTSLRGKFVAAGVLPVGVDPADDRVRSIIDRCRNYHKPSKFS